VKAEELAKTDDKDKAAVTAKYDALILNQKNSMGLAEISKLTRGFKASDLMGTNKIHIGTTFEMILSTFQSRGEKYARVTRESRTLQPRTDGSDSFY
jgi:hypothetical protein